VEKKKKKEGNSDWFDGNNFRIKMFIYREIMWAGAAFSALILAVCCLLQNSAIV
jgi:hypothetical protein